MNYRSQIVFFTFFLTLLSGCTSVESTEDPLPGSDHGGNTEEFQRADDPDHLSFQAESGQTDSEIFRTDRFFYDDPSTGTENREEKKLKAIWRNSECKKLLPPCITTCRAAKTFSYMILHFVIGNDDCESRCRAETKCPLNP